MTATNIAKISTLKATLKSLQGRFFSVDYVKKDGTPRTSSGRCGVTKYLKGGECRNKNVEALIIYDTKSKGYRTINLDTIQCIRANNMVIPVFDRKE